MRIDQPMGEAAAEIVAARVKKATKLLRAAEKGEIEGVHDLRVAVRKLRAAVSVLEGSIFSAGELAREDDALSELFDALGVARDDDVMRQRIEKLAGRSGLDDKAKKTLTRDLARDRKRAHKKLLRTMKDAPPQKTFERLAKKVVSAKAPRPDADGVPRTLVRHFAASTLLTRWEAVLAYETALPASLPVLHRLRLAIKKLRYAVAFFEDVLGVHATRLDRPLAGAQDVLGDLHDHAVARAYVAAIAQKKRARRKALEVIEAEDKEGTRLLEKFDAVWRDLSSERFAAELTRATQALVGPRAVSKRKLALRRAAS